MIRKIMIRRMLVAILLAATPAICLGQADSGTILGNVTDASGYVIPGASVVVQNMGTGSTRTLTTDSAGSFISPPLSLGNYDVTVSAKGFAMQSHTGITLHVDDRIQLRFTLKPGSQSQTIKVSSQAPLIQTASTTLGGVVNEKQVENLPLNGRSVSQLVALVPGVMLRGSNSQQSVGGKGMFSTEGGVHFTLDGGDASMINSDLLTEGFGASSSRLTRVSVDAVKEFRVSTDLYSAQYGDTMGGQINLITKSGTNRMHGSLYEYFRNNVLDARDYFNPPPQNQPAYRLNQYGATIGGPIVRNRLFYFLTYEGIQQRTGTILRAVVPTADARALGLPVMQSALAQLPLPNGPLTSDPRFGNYTIGVSNPLSANSGMAKLDYMISHSDHFSGRLNVNKNLTTPYAGVGTGQQQSATMNRWIAMLNETHTFTPHLVNDASFYFNQFAVVSAGSTDPTVRFSPVVSLGEGAALGPSLFDVQETNNSYTGKDVVTWVHGNQQISFGGDITKIQTHSGLNLRQMVVYLTFDQALQNQAFLDMQLGGPLAKPRNTYYSAFFQDDYQVHPRLTLNMGLRYQYDSAITEAEGRIRNMLFPSATLTPVGDAHVYPQKLLFAPRFGVAYSLNPAGTTVVRAGFGIFYGHLYASNIQGSLPANAPNMSYAASVTSLQIPGLVGLPFPDISQFAVPSTTFSALDPHIQTPYTEKWSLNLQQALGKSAMFEVGYIGNRGLHLIENVDLNRLNPGGQSRPYPQYGSLNYRSGTGISSYNGLQLVFKKRFDNGMSFHANYTWSHSLDDAPVVFTNIQDDHNPRADYASSTFDVTNNVEIDASYLIPDVPKLPRVVGHGWQYNTIAEMRSGFPFDVTCGCDPLHNGTTTSRADLVPGVNPRPSNFNVPYNQLNPDAFAVPVGHYGTLPRDYLRGPRAINFDMSLFKNFPFMTSQNIQFRTEVFNIFNHPQFSNPSAALNNMPQFGQSLSTLTTSVGFHTDRQIQFALRYSF